MAYLEIRGQRHPIGTGEMVIGCDAANAVALGGEELHSKSVILQGMPDGQVAVKRADAESEVLINGVRLGPHPTPLLHGDKIEIAGQELLFVDDRRSGSTEYIKAVDPLMIGGSSKSKSKGGATAGTGGRLVSLTDGREYEITAGSILIGRDAGCDIVISAKNVSRRHCEVVATPRGYVVIDNSTNGILVNNESVQGQHLLSRADVIRCGDHEFRFYADAAEMAEERSASPAPSSDDVPPPALPQPPVAAAPAPEPPAAQVPGPEEAPIEQAAPPAAPEQVAPTPPPSPPPGLAAPPPTPPRGAEQRLAHTLHGIPAMPRAGQPPPQPPSPPAAPPTPPQSPSPASPLPLAPPPGAEQQLQDTMHGITEDATPPPTPPASPTEGPPGTPPVVESMPPAPPAQEAQARQPAAAGPPPARPTRAPKSLASLLVRSGSLKGQRLHVKVPIVNIGRAEYNDIVLPDESVSTVHAKLQRREGIWVLVDLESTNGTIVDGELVDGEAPLAPGAIVRFGTIQTVFEPTDDSVESQQGGGTQVLQRVKFTPPGDPGRSDSSGAGAAPDGGTPLK